MNIAHITESTGISGGTQQLILLIKGLKKNGHKIHLICQPESKIGNYFKESGIKIKPIKMRQDYDIFSALNLRRYLVAEKIDILHSHHSRAHSIGLLATLGLKKIKFVVSRRVIFKLRNNIFSRLKYKSKKIDKYIAVSKSVKDMLVNYGIKNEKVNVIYSATNTDIFSPIIRSKIRDEFNIPQTDFVCCLIGNYSYYKGHTFFLEATKKVTEKYKNIKFLIVGKTNNILQDLAKKLQLENDVIFLNFRTDIPQILKASNLLVCPSLQEGLAGAIREALAMEVPVVATAVGGNSEIVRNYETGVLVEPRNSSAISDAIIFFIKNPDEAKKMGENGRKTVLENFSIDTMVSKHEKVYEELMYGKS